MIQIYKGSIYSFKLLSGEEIIAQVVDVEVDEIDILSPLGVTLTAQGPDTFPGMIAGDVSKSMTLSRASISIIAEVEEHIKNSYLKAVEEMVNTKKEQQEEKDAKSM